MQAGNCNIQLHDHFHRRTGPTGSETLPHLVRQQLQNLGQQRHQVGLGGHTHGSHGAGNGSQTSLAGTGVLGIGEGSLNHSQGTVGVESRDAGGLDGVGNLSNATSDVCATKIVLADSA
jgi:hypothetical protein